MRRYFVSLLLSISIGALYSQDCSIKLSGYILEKGLNNEALPFSTVYLEDRKIGINADGDGFFELPNLCPGEYHIAFSHIGCTPEKLYFSLKRDTVIRIYLEHHSELLDEIVVHGDQSESTAQVSSSINRSEINRESNKGLSEILESIAGVSILKSGSGISKPVVHGLFGNRVSILNNGIAQAGQQWGNDHAPEIDPSAADHLSVVKGASALAYGGSSLGSVILVEPGKISEDPHLHSGLNYIFQSNGRGSTLNTRMEQTAPWGAWRVSGTMKSTGDSHSPDYFLTNTGKKEANIALQMDKKWSERWNSHFYYSLFTTEIGVLRGSHIGNLTDLESALGREEPFFTSNNFSRTIDAPKQEVKHHLLKLQAVLAIQDEASLKFSYGGQLNNRKEFDVRRSGRSELPSLSLNQYSHFFETVYEAGLSTSWFMKSGIQFAIVDNANEAGTGILPLIPRYVSYTPSGFVIFQKERDQFLFEVGGRYDMKNLQITTTTTTLPREIEEFDHVFHNFAFSMGVKSEINENLSMNINGGYMYRAPEVNELYSYGLHQGVSGIEEGQRNLIQEKSLKFIYSVDWRIRHTVFLQSLAYFQRIEDYIYLQPQNEFRLTIRGAFPLFVYQQTDAQLYGMDVQMIVDPSHSLKVINKYSMVRGQDISNNIPLIYMPSDNFSSTFRVSLKPGTQFIDNYLSIRGKYVWKQKRLEDEQDFLAPPNGYFLLEAALGSSIRIKKSELELSITADNILNERYRDYLDRLRYFANAQGRNISIRLNYIFAR